MQERSTDWLPPVHAWTRDHMHCDRESHPQPFSYRMTFQPLGHTGQGSCYFVNHALNLGLYSLLFFSILNHRHLPKSLFFNCFRQLHILSYKQGKTLKIRLVSIIKFIHMHKEHYNVPSPSLPKTADAIVPPSSCLFFTHKNFQCSYNHTLHTIWNYFISTGRHLPRVSVSP